MIGTLYILPANNNISECYKLGQAQSGFGIENDGLYMVFTKVLSPITLREAEVNNQTVVSNTMCTIIKGLNTNEIS